LGLLRPGQKSSLFSGSTWIPQSSIAPLELEFGNGRLPTKARSDAVMACAGDVPTLEALAAVDLLRQHFPDIKIRVVNVVDLMALEPSNEHPHGLSDREFDSIFTTDKPVIFAYHGYPSLIHRLTPFQHNGS
jgi:phosphoketolase